MTSGRYFNKGVMALDVPDIGHVVRETDDKIVIFGEYNYRFDVRKSKIKEVGRNVILDMEYPELFKFIVDRNTPLPSDESIVKVVDE
jgi:hypothetical protein